MSDEMGRFPIAAKRIASVLHLDRSLGFVLGTRLWQGLSGPVTITFIVAFLSPDQQGIYYGIFSIVAIQAFFELGLLNVLVSHAGHEAAKIAKQSEESKLAQRRLGSLIGGARKWFAIASGLFVAIAIVVGWNTISGTQFQQPVNWQGPLLCVMPLAGLGVFYSAQLAILEGVGDREAVYRYRFLQAVMGSIMVWGSLAAGLQLWCLVAATATQAFWGAYVCSFRFREYFRTSTQCLATENEFSWYRDVLPSQWRMALVSVSHWVASQTFTLVLLWFHTAVEAGRMGMTLVVTGAIQMVALAWVQTKYPLVATLQGSDQREAAGTLWRKIGVISTMLLVVALGALVAIVEILPRIDARFDNRFIEPWQIAVLGIGCIANHLIALQGFYVLARRLPPILNVVPGMLICGMLVWVCGYRFATQGIVLAYTLSTALIVLPIHTWAYIKLRRTGESAT